MKLLLDTHTFLWLRSTPDKVSSKVLQAYQEPSNEIYLSIVSVWEMQIKHQLGKLQLDIPLKTLIEDQCNTNGLKILPLRLRHIFDLQNLPFHHKDPFDRLLIVQTQTENIVLVSSDNKFGLYKVNLFW